MLTDMQGNPTSSTREALAEQIWRACDTLRRDDNCGGVMAYVEHLAWLLFLRFLDAQETRWETGAGHPGLDEGHPEPVEGHPELVEGRYKPVLEEDLRWSAWARRDWEPQELLNFVQGRLIPALQALSGSPARETVRDIFSGHNVVVAASPHNLRDVVRIVDGIDFHSRDDIFTVSQVYEELLHRLGQQNRVAGEFYTPRPVVRFMVRLVRPQPGETVYDPACGSCGFLVEAHEQAAALPGEPVLVGQEKKALPALLGLMNLVLHGASAPDVRRRNTLEEGTEGVDEQFDVILTNPPFGGTENLRTQSKFPVRSNATELLFLQHVMAKLKRREGVRCGMVVPEGILFRGGAFAEVKRELLERFDLHTLVSLPPGTFAPYSDVKTALLFFQWPGPTRELWTYELPLPEGLKKFSKGNPIQETHFHEARALWAAWDAYRRGDGPRPEPTAHSWIVPAEEIAARDYDLTARNPKRRAATIHGPPQRSAAALLEKERESLALLKELLCLARAVDQETAASPESWDWKPLAEPQVAEILMGQSPPGHTYNEEGEGLPFFQGKADFGPLSPTPRKWCTAPIKIARPGDVLISVRAPVGPTNLCTETCCIGRGLAAIRPGPQMDSRFLLFALRGLEPQIARRGQGSTFAGITRGDLESLRVPVPPLEEQRRVAAYLQRVHGQLAALQGLHGEAAEALERLQVAALGAFFHK